MNAYDCIAEGNVADTNIFLFGASGYGYAMSLVLQSGFWPHTPCVVVGFIDDDEGGRGALLEGKPILSFAEWQDSHGSTPVLVSVGTPLARSKIVERFKAASGCFAQPYAGAVSSRFPGVQIGVGTFIGPMTYIGPFTKIGAHTQIMSACSIGHDVEIGEFCTICPSCTVSGYVVIEPGVFLGAGTTIVNGRANAPIRIGRNAKISAGSVVTKSVAENARLAGNPARTLREIATERGSVLLRA